MNIFKRFEKPHTNTEINNLQKEYLEKLREQIKLLAQREVSESLSDAERLNVAVNIIDQELKILKDKLNAFKVDVKTLEDQALSEGIIYTMKKLNE